jgi:hypothetical protein
MFFPDKEPALLMIGSIKEMDEECARSVEILLAVLPWNVWLKPNRQIIQRKKKNKSVAGSLIIINDLAHWKLVPHVAM